LLEVSAFPNSQDFNAISAVLNRRVEEQVLPRLRAKAVIGARVRFVGGAEVDDPASALPLRVVPIRMEWP
jgi:predicted lipoprotein